MTDRKKYHADWRACNRQHVNRYSRDYTDRNKEQRKQSTKAFRERDKVKPESVIKQLLRTARTNAKKKNVIFDRLLLPLTDETTREGTLTTIFKSYAQW